VRDINGAVQFFKEKFGLNKKEEVSAKEKEKILDMEEAFKLGKKEFVAYAERTSEKRYMQNILFGKHESGIENFMRDVEPQSILDKILGRGQGHKENEEWREV
jgi:hypothetical protein